jgi:hypothetical protein
MKKKFQQILAVLKYPRALFSSLIYQLYVNLKKKLSPLNILYYVGLIVIVLFLIEQGYYEETKLTAILGALSLLIGYLISYLVIKHKIKNKGVNFNSRFPMKHLLRIEHGLFYIDKENIIENQFILAEQKDALKSAEINIKAYQGGVWGTDVNDKYIRNLSHIEKNKLSILLIKSFDSDDLIGYTHILPVNERIWNIYTLGKIKDNEFNSDYIAPFVDSIYDEPFGLILFAIALPIENENISTDKLNYLSDLLEQCLSHHLSLFLDTTFKSKKTVKVMFQNYDEVFYSPFEKEAINDKMLSADNAPIYIFNVTDKSIKM